MVMFRWMNRVEERTEEYHFSWTTRGRTILIYDVFASCDRREPFTVDEGVKLTAGQPANRPAVGLDVTLTWLTHVVMLRVVGEYVFGGFSAR